MQENGQQLINVKENGHGRKKYFAPFLCISSLVDFTKYTPFVLGKKALSLWVGRLWRVVAIKSLISFHISYSMQH